MTKRQRLARFLYAFAVGLNACFLIVTFSWYGATDVTLLEKIWLWVCRCVYVMLSIYELDSFFKVGKD